MSYKEEFKLRNFIIVEDKELILNVSQIISIRPIHENKVFVKMIDGEKVTLETPFYEIRDKLKHDSYTLNSEWDIGKRVKSNKG